MWKGTSALNNIDLSLTTIRDEVVRIDAELSRLTGQMGQNHRHRAKLFNDIARVRLAEIESGELNVNYTAADQHAAELLSQREGALENLNQQIDQINERIQSAEIHRETLLQSANVTAQKIAEIEGQVQQQLEADNAYFEQYQKAKKAESVADEAQQKTLRAQANMAEKAEPYQADDLFIYLWNRGYGTTEYEAGLLSRAIDAWLAKLINYEPSRVNYWNLIEIPKRLSEHSERVGDEADEQHKILQDIEVGALEAAGAAKLKFELDDIRLKLDEHDDRIESIETDLNQCVEQRMSYISGEDQYIAACIERISESLEHQSMDAIHHYVSGTNSTTDDRLVLELQDIDSRIRNIKENLVDVRGLQSSKLGRLKELEKVRRDFKNSRFDDARSGFGNQALIMETLSQFLRGGASGRDVWRVIKRNQRYRKIASTPEFGSGGLGEIVDVIGGEVLRHSRRQRRSHRGSTWQWPKPRRGGGGGGFKTGGGF